MWVHRFETLARLAFRLQDLGFSAQGPFVCVFACFKSFVPVLARSIAYVHVGSRVPYGDAGMKDVGVIKAADSHGIGSQLALEYVSLIYLGLKVPI